MKGTDKNRDLLKVIKPIIQLTQNREVRGKLRTDKFEAHVNPTSANDYLQATAKRIRQIILLQLPDES
jgi:hypothetical protein